MSAVRARPRTTEHMAPQRPKLKTDSAVIRTRTTAQSTTEATPSYGSQVADMQYRRLLLAITEVVGEAGLGAASVGRVCEQAGVSRRTFYELFADREACLLAAVEAQLQRLDAQLAAVCDRSERWLDGVREAVRMLLERFEAEPGVARLCVVESARAGRRVLECRRIAIETIVSKVDEGRARARAGAEPPPLTVQGVVGGAMTVIQERLLLDGEQASLVELSGPLTAMIVHPYLGATAARRELERPPQTSPNTAPRAGADPFRGLPIRFTYRTALVLATIANSPGASNRDIARASDIADDGQVSRLLARLRDSDLIINRGAGHTRGQANAWTLTPRGQAIHQTIQIQE